MGWIARGRRYSPAMFAHVTIRVADLPAACERLAAALAPLGHVRADEDGGARWGELRLRAAESAAEETAGLHVGFVAPSREAVDAFWQAGVDAGLRDDGAPGPRPRYRDDYYGAFLRDPAGNSLEAVRHGAPRSDGIVDHLWVRVADVDAARAFYDALAPATGLRMVAEEPGRIRYRGPGAGGGSLTLVAGELPTTGLHIGLPASEAATVLDPDGNRIELVVPGRGS
jgi:catechol 2,3-dioxygenase-like lactoylglutathione lyase family enzyme